MNFIKKEGSAVRIAEKGRARRPAQVLTLPEGEELMDCRRIYSGGRGYGTGLSVRPTR